MHYNASVADFFKMPKWGTNMLLGAVAILIPLMIITIITCYIGMFFAAPISIFSWHHLQKQIYQLYLARGGEPIPLNPKLQDVPPRLPAT